MEQNVYGDISVKGYVFRSGVEDIRITIEFVELLEEKKPDEESPSQKLREISHQVTHAQVDIWQIRKKND